MANPFWWDENTLVIKAAELDKVVAHLCLFGLKFVAEKHVDGPFHYSCSVGDKVLEIYPKKEAK